MNETKHTSGPWIMHSGAVYKPDGTEDGYPIAHMDRNTPKTMPCERDANARLIAAAPDLLEALQGMISAMWQHWEYYHDGEDGLDNGSCNFALDKARAALAKATGGAA